MTAPNQPANSTTDPIRRFAPVPVETSTRSSKRKPVEAGQSNDGTTPITETPKQDGSAQPSARRFLPEPVESTVKSSRRKLPEAVENQTTSSRSKEHQSPSPTGQDQPKRRFVPEPIETSERRRGNRRNSHRGEMDVEMDDVATQAGNLASASQKQSQTKRRFIPQPVETTTRRRGNRRNSHRSDVDDEEMTDAPSRQSSAGSTSSSLRRFSPELVETVRGSYRRRRTPGANSPENGKSPTGDQFSQHDSQTSLSTPKVPPPTIHDSRFSAANLSRRQQPEKQHSFMVPDLQTIISDSSAASSNESSTATSPTTMSADGKSHRTNKASQDHVEGRILELAARVAERQLREQLIAGFPTEHDYHPVNHFAFDEDDEALERPGHFMAQGNIPYSRFRRDSAADLDLELSKMRDHQAELQKAEQGLREKAEATGDSKFSAAALAAKKGMEMNRKEDSAKAVGQWQKDVGLAQMRQAASPPMLGGDIKFPFSLSPKHTRCETDQAPVPRRQDTDGDEVMEEQKLWTVKVSIENDKDTGLWMGTCAQKSIPATPGTDGFRRSGLMTPAVEIDDPFSSIAQVTDPLWGTRHLPLTPASSHNDPAMDNIDQMLHLEKSIEEEFNDAFVTQIYNYISLGYPSLAHPFDDELSKISRIPIEELRRDDQRTDAKGYVGAPEGTGLGEQDMVEGKCARWLALRLYIREWARQRPEMVERYPNDWGSRVRKGSWAI